MSTIPVIALTGHLGAGKTTVLNHVLRDPDARIGVVVNDFGAINIDAGLVTGHIDEAASIAGGCICCIEDAGGLASALERLAAPRLALDAILVEASGLADPVAVVSLIATSGVRGIRFGGLVDVVDAAEHFATVDRFPLAPLRYLAATLVVVNKLDRIAPSERLARFERIRDRIHDRNERAHVIGASDGRIDRRLLFDVARRSDDELPIRQLLIEALREQDDAAHGSESDQQHSHADSVSVTSQGTVDAGAVLDLLQRPPPGVYRIKGTVHVARGTRIRTFLVNLAGSGLHVTAIRQRSASTTGTHDGDVGQPGNTLVGIGTDLDVEAVRDRFAQTIAPTFGHDRTGGEGLRRLEHWRRLSAPASRAAAAARERDTEHLDFGEHRPAPNRDR